MRFRRLDIPAYGPFTELGLDFSSGAADFHLIHGRNEAGKSSLLRAIRDLLYGIPPQTPDAFLHDYSALRIGAELENRAGQRLAMQRRKGLRNTLLDAAGNALADDALAPYIGPVDRDFFTAMFGLGSDDLRRGAHELLQGKGELGQALFAASLAGTPIHQVLDQLDREARELFDGKAWKNVRIRPALDAHATGLRDSREAQIKPEAWEEALRELDAARTEKTETERELADLRRRQDWLARCRAALPIRGRLRETQARMADLPPLPDLPSDFAASAQAAKQRLADAELALSELHQRICEHDSRLANLGACRTLGSDSENRHRRDQFSTISPGNSRTIAQEMGEKWAGEACLQPEIPKSDRLLTPRQDALACSGDIDALTADLALYRKEQTALANEMAEARQRTHALADGLRELGLPPELENIPSLRLPLPEQLAYQAAAETLQGVEREDAAQREQGLRLHDEIARANSRLKELPQGDVAPLRAALASSHAANHADDAGRAAELDRLARRLAGQQQHLPGAPADPAAIYALRIPAAARLREFADSAARLDDQARQLTETGRELDRQRGELASQLARLQQRGQLPGLDDLAAARQTRDAGWSVILRDGLAAYWNDVPASASYPNAVAAADAIADRLREEADAIAQAEDLRARLSEIERADAARQQEQTALDAARQRWQEDWLGVLQTCGLLPPPPPGEGPGDRESPQPGAALPTPAEMQEWRDAWLEFRSRYEAWRDLAEERAQVQTAIAAAEARLRPLLDGVAADLAHLRQLAEARLRAADQAEGERRAQETRRTELHEAEADLQRRQPALTAELAAARADWAKLAGNERPEIALPLMARRQQLVADHDTWGRLDAGIETKRRSAQHYVERAAACSKRLGLEVIGVENQVAELGRLLAQARDLATRQRQVEEDRALDHARLQGLKQAAAAARADFANYLARARVADPESLQTLLDHLESRERLAAQLQQQQGDLAEQARGEALTDFLARVEAEDPALLESATAALNEAIHEREARRERAIQALARAEDGKARLEASDDTAASHLQNAHHAAARIRQDTARFLRLRLAGQYLRAQIDAYRARNQGPMLARAGAYFRQMTGGSFSGLATDYDRSDTPVLVGLKGEQKVPVEGMSEGSRDQLYLALRLAAIEQHQTAHEPMPLILDDLFITFDDQRSRAIFPLLADLARSSQVLLFTHHSHLADLALDCLPAGAITVHELPGG